MKVKTADLRKKTFAFLAMVLSPLLICLSYPGVFEKGCWQTGLIMFIPCLYILYKLPLKWASVFGIYVGTVSMAIVAYPMVTFGPMTFIGCAAAYIGELLYGGLCYAILFSLCAVFMKKKGVLGPVFTGFVFALMTWYQASDTLLSPVYFSIPTVLWERNILLQTADIWGAEGIAFLMGFTQGLVVRIIVHIEEKDFKSIPLYSVALFLTAAFVIGYGIHSTDRWGNYKDEGSLKAALIQHNGPNRSPGSSYNIEKFHQLAEQAKRQEPDIIVSAESLYTLPVIYLQRMNYLKKFMAETDPAVKTYRDGIKLLDQLYMDDVPVLLGTLSSPINEMSYEEVKEMIANSDSIDVPLLASAALMKNGLFDLDSINEKSGLSVIEKAPSILSKISRDIAPIPLIPGKSKNLWLGEVNIGCFLCIEDSMRHPAFQKIKDGAQIFITMASSYDTLGTAFLYQHLSSSIFTSIANRRSMLRACNSGITCAILPTGEIIQEITPCEAGFLIAEAPLNTYRTLYSFYPVWFGVLACVVVTAALLFDVVRYMQKKRIINAAFIMFGFLTVCYFVISQIIDLGIHLLLGIGSACFIGPLLNMGYSTDISKKVGKSILKTFLYGVGGLMLLISIVFFSCIGATRIMEPVLINQYDVEKNNGQIWKRQTPIKIDEIEYEGYLIFMDDGEFHLVTIFENEEKWLTVDRCRGSWKKENKDLVYTATSQFTGSVINERCSIKTYTVKGKEKMVLIYEDGTGETFVKISN